MTTQKALDNQRSIAYDIMATALDRSLPILTTLEVGAASVYDSKLKSAFLSIRDSIREGDNLTDAMRKTGFGFYEYEYEEMNKGEENGEVDVVLHGLAKRLNPNS